jgi:hypothetical protein
MKSKGHLYIYIHQVFGKSQKNVLTSIYCSIQEKSYMFRGLSLSSDSAKLEKS